MQGIGDDKIYFVIKRIHGDIVPLRLQPQSLKAFSHEVFKDPYIYMRIFFAVRRFLGDCKRFSALFALKPLRANGGLSVRAVSVRNPKTSASKYELTHCGFGHLSFLLSGFRYAEILSISSFIPLLLLTGNFSLHLPHLSDNS